MVSNSRLAREYRKVCVALLFCAAIAIPAQAQTFTSLANFSGTDGALPGYGPLVLGLDGNLYGTTEAGGIEATGTGTVYNITPGGTLTMLYSFACHVGCPNGNSPYAGLVLATSGDFFGTTSK